MSATIADPMEYVRSIYHTAREVSHETRRELAGHLDGGTYADPRPRWEHVLAGRAGRGIGRSVSAAGNRVTRAAAAGQLGGHVRHAVQSLVRAVEELAGFVPAYETWTRYDEHLERDVSVYMPTAESVEHLDELRQRVYVRLVELDEALRGYPDPLGRLLAVMKRVAVRLLPTAEAARMCRWVERLERDAG
ncbi:MAG: hypothetical protein U0804_17165 [Gemmataceae bacterium]